MVVPAFGDQRKLDLTLAGLATQTYPADLLEVIVVDNGSTPPLRLPEIRPRETRLVVCETPGRANARNAGLAAATGDVIHWMDSDVVPERQAVEAHMRWHHLAPYLVVTSYLSFTAAALPSPAEVEAAEDLEKFFEPSEPHSWIADLVERSEGLIRTHRAFSVHIGGATSVNARLLERTGGMDAGVFLGQDTELGYRLAQAGAVFIADPEARGYHLGPSMRMRDRSPVHRVSHALVTGRIPAYKWLRAHPARQWRIPRLEVVVDATRGSYEDVRATVDAVLAGTLTDLSVLLTGPWDELVPDRRTPLSDPNLDLVLVRSYFEDDGRVRLVSSVDETFAPYRLHLPVGWVPGEDTLYQLLTTATEDRLGLISVLLSEGPEGITHARLERTEAFARARMLVTEGEEIDAVVDETFGTRWVEGETYPFATAAAAERLMGSREAYQARVNALAEVERLTKEVERLRGQVTRWRDEAARWRKSAVQFRREMGALRKEIGDLKRPHGLRDIARGLARSFKSAGGTG
jgi:glycosyltransferase involved in cell wall biosynthesis